jgi:flagellar biosynthesis/type III secretory pathway M-ring protein FliF/YscJ
VKGAAGFVENRDFVAVEVVPFAEPAADEATPVAGFPWEQLNKILQNVSLGIAAILAFLVTLLALRKFGTATAPTTPPLQLSQDNSNRVNQLSQLLTQNPRCFHGLLPLGLIPLPAKLLRQRKTKSEKRPKFLRTKNTTIIDETD